MSEDQLDNSILPQAEKNSGISEITTPPINEQEIREITGNEEFSRKIFEGNTFIRENPVVEAGFTVIKDIDDGSEHWSDVGIGSEASFSDDDLNFPTFPKEKMGGINILPSGLTAKVTGRDSWKSLEVLNVHFHPLRKADSKPSWFNASHFDRKDTSSNSKINALKLRVLSGISADLLRSTDPPNGNSEHEQLARDLHNYYGFLFTGFFAPTKLETADRQSPEAKYRSYTGIAMSLSETKVQLLLLTDDPESEGTNWLEEPDAFKKPPFDLEPDPEAARQILDYYKKLGYDPSILFIEKDERANIQTRLLK